MAFLLDMLSDLGQRIFVQKQDISTLVFLDLESTGLPNTVGKANVQITEVSMIAMAAADFTASVHDDLRDVRVVNKLTMCVRPRAAIDPVAQNITGLSNAGLERQAAFAPGVARTLVSFVASLPAPVCILAHNGATFDFPLLRAELRGAGAALPRDTLVADTLQAFRRISIPGPPPCEQVPKAVKYLKDGSLSCALKNLHLYFFKRKPFGSHSSEGDCVALAKVCRKVKEDLLPWLDANRSPFDSVEPMW